MDDSSDCQEIGVQVYYQFNSILIFRLLTPHWFFNIFDQEKCKVDINKSLTEELRIILLDDLVDKCRPGDHVEIRYW